jgi:mono/diheme cytochrome c family protein
MSALVWVLLAGCLLVACRTEQTFVEPDPHLERMLVQPKVLAYQQVPFLPEGMAMQSPPPGTLPVDAIADDARVTAGLSGDHWVERIPVPLSRELLQQGRERFERFCAACHGVLGDGVSVVADKMTLRRPENLQEDRIRAYPAGRVFQTIRKGYGLMPSYDVQLSVRETWAVVAYVRALQLAREARVADLPPQVRDQLTREAQ